LAEMDCVPVRTGSGNGLFNECLCPDQRFKAVDGGDTFSVGVVAGTGEVIAWGRAFYGELPAEGASATKLATPEPCQAVSCGTNHVLALTISGRVVASGWNRSGQAAAPATVEVVPVPAVVKFPDPLTKIVAVAAGGMHSLAIDSCGQVWAWGCNAYGQLGVDSELEQLHTPTLVAFPHNARVAHIAAGWAHSALVSTTGEVFTFGWGLYNQLGHGSTQDEHRPVAVDALHGLESDIVQVACGTWHTAGKVSSISAWSLGDYLSCGVCKRSADQVRRPVHVGLGKGWPTGAFLTHSAHVSS
jgi:alpha-tubulin suppressor-like RCC1 family protein